jgi:hypothetical protein
LWGGVGVIMMGPGSKTLALRLTLAFVIAALAAALRACSAVAVAWDPSESLPLIAAMTTGPELHHDSSHPTSATPTPTPTPTPTLASTSASTPFNVGGSSADILRALSDKAPVGSPTPALGESGGRHRQPAPGRSLVPATPVVVHTGARAPGDLGPLGAFVSTDSMGVVVGQEEGYIIRDYPGEH